MQEKKSAEPASSVDGSDVFAGCSELPNGVKLMAQLLPKMAEMELSITCADWITEITLSDCSAPLSPICEAMYQRLPKKCRMTVVYSTRPAKCSLPGMCRIASANMDAESVVMPQT
eukprot:3605195-Prymnesium_polylepis.1